MYNAFKNKKNLLLLCLLLLSYQSYAQREAQHYADSILNKMKDEEKVAQLLMITAYSNKDSLHTAEIVELIKRYKIGGLIFFQGSPTKQAELTNYYQSLSAIPLFIFMDAEYGLGMRLDSITPLPHAIMLGAMTNKQIVYDYAKIIANQCKRIGVHFNLGPVVDVNTNPENPVINFRSFGENHYKVANFGVQYIKGLQDNNVFACAKHFPGHGDVDVDSHEDLPILKKNLDQLNEIELLPFAKSIQEANVKSILVAHLSLPKIINKRKIPSSVSSEIINDLLKNNMNFKGICITDALNMKGFKKFVEDDEVALKTLLAGNDLLCMPDNIQFALNYITKEMNQNPLFKQSIEDKVRKILLTKYELITHQAFNKISYNNLTDNLNKWTQTNFMERVVKNSLTIAKFKDPKLFTKKYNKIVYVAIGENEPNRLSFLLGREQNVETLYFNTKNNDKKDVKNIIQSLSNNSNTLFIVGIHNYSNSIKNDFGITKEASLLISKISEFENHVLIFFGNPYAIKNFTNASNIIVAYNNSNEAQSIVAKTILNEFYPQGKMPISINEIVANQGVSSFEFLFENINSNEKKQLLKDTLFSEINNIVLQHINEKAFPGCQIFVAKKNKILFNKSYGNHTYEAFNTVDKSSIYDLASLTKVFATTLAIMKLIDQKKIKLNDKISKYLLVLKPFKDKSKITIKELLTHTSGLVSWIPFYQKTINKSNGLPLPNIYSKTNETPFIIPVAENLYMNTAWKDSLLDAFYTSKLSEKKYVYSDIGFIFLAQIVERITNQSLEDFVVQEFYEPLGLNSTYFKPLEKISSATIVSTENEKIFRNQLLRGYVHDYTAAMLGGIAGNAGLFSNTQDLAILSLLLLNNGQIGNKSFINTKTMKLFTKYQSSKHRRGLGFDKPEIEANSTYPSKYASPQTFGHTGFTGTCFWVDPKNDLIFIFLSNRIHPSSENKKIQTLKTREKILNYIYENLK